MHVLPAPDGGGDDRVAGLVDGGALALGQGSTGAEQDFEHATWLAREIAGRYGMTESIGRVRILAHDADEFLGATLGLNQMSERMHEAFDDEVRSILDRAEKRAEEIVQANSKQLDTLVATLLDRETLEGANLLAALGDVVAAAPKNGGSKAR